MSRRVLVVPTQKLMALVGMPFEGFLPVKRGVVQLISRIEDASHWMDKNAAEENPDFKQIIPYHAVRCQNGNVFVYQRATEDKAYQERRLQGKYSIGIGGHIDEPDGIDILGAAKREIEEEIEIDYEREEAGTQFIGCININDTPVNSVHFGLFFVINISSDIIRPKDPEIAWGEAIPLGKIEELFKKDGINVEGWTQITLPHIR